MSVCSLGAWTCSGWIRLQNDVFSSFQDGPLCSPAGRECIRSNSEETFDCQVPCEGLYADVSKLQVPKNSQYDKIVEEYLNYKRSYVKNVRFNASAHSTFSVSIHGYTHT